jgi:hypothetical protein
VGNWIFFEETFLGSGLHPQRFSPGRAAKSLPPARLNRGNRFDFNCFNREKTAFGGANIPY